MVNDANKRMARDGARVLATLLGALLAAACSGGPKKLQPAPIRITKQIVKGSGRDPCPMVAVAAGPFLQGSPGGTGEADEQPQRQIFVDGFAIDQFDVSVAQYRRCVADGICSDPNKDSHCNWRYDDREEHPINCVSWDQAKTYCTWAGKRLPTEAEWEKAARGVDGRLYSWGNEAPTCERVNFNASPEQGKDRYCHGQTVPVTEYQRSASPYGAVQITGNVYNWVADWYGREFYSQGPLKNPRGPSSGKYRVVRGGSWFSLAKDLRLALRGLIPPAVRLNYVGFRCAKDI